MQKTEQEQLTEISEKTGVPPDTLTAAAIMWRKLSRAGWRAERIRIRIKHKFNLDINPNL